MKKTITTVAVATLAIWLCGDLVAERASAARPPFRIQASDTFAWTGRLVLEEQIAGSAHVETEPWVPCGGTPPGDSLKWRPPLYEGDTGGYYLVDGEGKTVAVCTGPPEPHPRLPTNLSLLIGAGCRRYEIGESVRLTPTTNRTLATAGTSSTEDVAFQASRQLPVRVGRNLNPPVCLVEHGSYEAPNQECAEYFNPELCAKEVKGYQSVIASAELRYSPSPTERCGAARKSARALRLRIHRLSARRKRGGPDLAARRRSKGLLHRYLNHARPRYLGECL